MENPALRTFVSDSLVHIYQKGEMEIGASVKRPLISLYSSWNTNKVATLKVSSSSLKESNINDFWLNKAYVGENVIRFDSLLQHQ